MNPSHLGKEDWNPRVDRGDSATWTAVQRAENSEIRTRTRRDECHGYSLVQRFGDRELIVILQSSQVAWEDRDSKSPTWRPSENRESEFSEASAKGKSHAFIHQRPPPAQAPINISSPESSSERAPRKGGYVSSFVFTFGPQRSQIA
jgi:hypothetical protein